jgi:hypothetical protein
MVLFYGIIIAENIVNQTGSPSTTGGHASYVMTVKSTHMPKLHGTRSLHFIRHWLKKQLAVKMKVNASL